MPKVNFRCHTPPKTHFLKSRKFTFLWKYLVCGLKFEISEYPLKSIYVTYSPYKYELKRIKTHEIRATYFWSFFFRALYGVITKNIQFQNIRKNFMFQNLKIKCVGLYRKCWSRFRIIIHAIWIPWTEKKTDESTLL